MSKPFIHLHLHTEYSLLDGAVTIKKLVQKAVKENIPALAITDHGNLYGAIKFYRACKNENIKPIIGCEVYVAEDMYVKEGRNTDEGKAYHLVLIAKNNTGFKNLSRLSSLGYLEGFHYKPRIDLNLLSQYSEGLICLSACLSGALSRYILKNDYEGAKEYAIRLKEMFAEGDFYIEIMDQGIDLSKTVNPQLARIAKEIGVKCVATNDVHYLNKEDAEMHDVLLCIQTASFYDDVNRMRFTTDQCYFKNYEEMEAAVGWCKEALETPYEIIDKCDIDFVFNQYQIPVFPCPNGMHPDDYLRQVTYEGLKNRYGQITSEIEKRTEDELKVILSMGFSEYYLIVWDFIRYARENDIPVGAGRGSGVGSIVAYAIGITNVEPLRFDLIFERFLNKDRTSMPDFDIDFCYHRRGEVIQYVKDKYGDDHISQIITFGKMKKKAAIKDVARVFRIPFADVTRLTKSIDAKVAMDSKIKLKDLINPNSPHAVKDLIEQYNMPEYKKVIDLAIQIEDMPRNTSMHAAGVVIYKHPALDTIPLARNGEEITTQFDMTEVESLGLLKMDFLALMTLTDVKATHDYVLKEAKQDINFAVLGYDNPEVYNYIGSGNTDAVFQLEGGGMKKFMTNLKPKTMEDIIAGISIYRPGPMQFIDKFLDNRKNPDKIEYRHPMLEPILKVTNGIIIYQEQAMTITRVLAGYNMTRADKFRAIISKKKQDLIPKERAAFVYGVPPYVEGESNVEIEIPGCIRNGISEKIALEIFAEMENFASYAFNKSHAAAYAVLAYETAYFKNFYTVEFMANVLTNRIGKPDDTKKYMQVLKNLKIRLLQPDINRSGAFFTPDKSTGADCIRYGLQCIKHVGTAAIESILKERQEGGNFKDLYDFLERSYGLNINRRMIESLIKGGAFDCFNLTRATLLANYEDIQIEIDKKKKRAESNQIDMFSMFLDEKEAEYQYRIVPDKSERERLFDEKEMLGMYITGHPLDGYLEEFEKFNFNTSMLPKNEEFEGDDDENGDDDDAQTIDLEAFGLRDDMDITMGGLIADVSLKRTRTGKEMAVIVIEDIYDRVEIVAFSKTVEDFKRYMVKDMLVKVYARLTQRDNKISIIVNEIIPWELAEKENAKPKDNRTLYFNIVENNQELWAKINSILASHAGDNAVRFQFNNQLYNHSLKIDELDVVAAELAGIIGSKNVKLM